MGDLLWFLYVYCPHRNDYNLNSDRLRNVIVSVIFAKLDSSWNSEM